MNIELNNKSWTKIQLKPGFVCITPQTHGSFYYSKTDLGTDVKDLNKRLDVVSFSKILSGNITNPTDIWMLSTEDYAIVSYETEIISGINAIILNSGGGGGSGPSGNYTFNNPLRETGGVVNLNFNTDGLKLQNGVLTLDLNNDTNFTSLLNSNNANTLSIQTINSEILDLQQDINTLEAQDNVFTLDINSLKTKVGNDTLQTTSKDLSGAINEILNNIVTNSLTFSKPLANNGNVISLSFENDLKLNQTGDKLTLDLLSNSDFNNALLGIEEAKKIADYTQVGRVMPMKNSFIINATGELTLDLTPNGVLANNFAPKSIETDVSSLRQDINRIDGEITDIDNQINLLNTGKADNSTLQALELKVTKNENEISSIKTDISNKANIGDVYTKTETYTQQEVNNLLDSKTDNSDFQNLSQKVTKNEGDIATNAGSIQTLQTSLTSLDGDVVKKTNITQSINGLKTFQKELTANNLKANNNGTGYGAVDIRNQDGYFSISKNDAGSVVTLLAELGFVDSNTTFRVRNKAGALITFNQIARYETQITPTQDMDLVPLATLNAAKTELLNKINSLQGGVFYVGEIQNTRAEVEARPQLLTDFVQQEQSRAPKTGDLVKTTDNVAFVFNGTDWVNFGGVSISIATATTAGIVMLGTADGELSDAGNGKVKVIGWDTLKQGVQDLNNRTSTNTQSIQTINATLQDLQQSVEQNTNAIATKANDSDVVKLTGDQDIAGIKKFTTGIKVEKTNPSIELRDSAGNKSTTIQTIDNGENLAFSVGSGSGAVQFNGKLRYPWNAIPTVTANNEIPALKQIKDQFASSTTVQGLVTRIDTNEGNITTLTGRVGAVETLAGQNETAIQGLTTKVTANEQAIQTLTPKVTANEQAIQSLSAKVTANEGAIQQNTTDIQGLNTSTQQNARDIQQNAQDIQANVRDIATKADDNAVVKLTGNQTVAGDKTFTGDLTLGTKLRMGYLGQTVLITPEDDSTKTLKFRDTSIGANNKFNLDLENVCGLTGIKDPESARDAVPRDWANNKYLSVTNTNTTTAIESTNNGNKYFAINHVWDGRGYRNWGGIQLNLKNSSSQADFQKMFSVEYKNTDDLGIFMFAIGNKITFDNPTKLVRLSCEDNDDNSVAVNKTYLFSKTGTLANLTTTAKDNLVLAINELKTSIDKNTSAIANKADSTAVVDLTSAQTVTGAKTFTANTVARNLQVNNNIGTTTGATSNLGAIDINGANRYITFSQTIGDQLTRTILIGFDTSTGNKFRFYQYLQEADGSGIASFLFNAPIEFVSNYTPKIDAHATTKKYVDGLIATLKAEIKDVVAQSTDFADFKTRIASW